MQLVLGEHILVTVPPLNGGTESSEHTVPPFINAERTGQLSVPLLFVAANGTETFTLYILIIYITALQPDDRPRSDVRAYPVMLFWCV